MSNHLALAKTQTLLKTHQIMTSDTIEIISAIAESVAAGAAVLALWFIGSQIKQARKTSDLLTLQAFLKDAKEHENALITAKSDEEKNQAFIELLNFLEVYAAALNNKLVPKVSKDFVHQKIRDSIVLIQSAPEWHPLLQGAITSLETFDALSKFMKDNKSEIGKLQNARVQLDTKS